jgi:hypothetical protein
MPPKGGIFLAKSMVINPMLKGQTGRSKFEGHYLYLVVSKA